MGQSERRFFMTTLPEDELKALQRDVERSLGRCMLQLQRYERLLKALVAHLEIAGPPQDLEAVRAARTCWSSSSASDAAPDRPFAAQAIS